MPAGNLLQPVATCCNSSVATCCNLLNDLIVTGSGIRTQTWHECCIYYGAPVQSALAELSMPTIVPEVGTMWTKPDFTEMRFGFEITMYIGNR